MAFNLSVDRFGNEGSASTTPIAIVAQSPAAVSIANNTPTAVVNWTTILNTAGTAWNAATGTFTCPKAGYYHISGAIEYGSASWGSGAILVTSFVKNGSIYPAGSRQVLQAGFTANQQSPVSIGIVQLAVGDTLKLNIAQVSGSAKTLAATSSSFFNINEI